MNYKSFSRDEWRTLVFAREFSSVKEAKCIAFGTVSNGNDTLEYYQAWQWLLTYGVELEESDYLYQDKLICDGVIFLD